MKRRTFMQRAGVGVAAAMLVPHLAADTESQLIYLSPIKSNGALSSCQAEVWFVREGEHRYVVTDATAWRSRAVRVGLSRTQVWEGDVGLWGSSDGAYKSLPASLAQASIIEDAEVHARLLDGFGVKYAREWSVWGPRFKKGLADGSRVLLRYSPA